MRIRSPKKDKTKAQEHFGAVSEGHQNIIIIGAGEVGMYLTNTLSHEGHHIVLIDLDPKKVSIAQENLDAIVLEGNGATPVILRQAGIENADLLVAVTASDESNLIACLSAKTLGKKIKTVARVRNPDFLEKNSHSGKTSMLGIDLVINPDQVAANDLVGAILTTGAVNVEHFCDKKILIAEIMLEKNSSLLDKPVGQKRLHEDYMLTAYTRKGQTKIIYDDTVLQASDHIFVTMHTKKAPMVIKALAGDQAKVEEAMIFGATKIGKYIAKHLEASGIHVKLLERDLGAANQAAESLSNVMVLQNDEINRDFLLQEGADKVQAFVSCTEDDPINLVAALNAKQLGCNLAFTVLSRSSYLPLIEAMDIDAAVSPRLHTAAAILRFLRRGHVISVQPLEGGAEMLEFEADPDSKIVGKPLKEAGIPHECVVSAIVRDGQIMYPKGDSVILPKDHVLVFAMHEVIPKLEKLFSR